MSKHLHWGVNVRGRVYVFVSPDVYFYVYVHMCVHVHGQGNIYVYGSFMCLVHESILRCPRLNVNIDTGTCMYTYVCPVSGCTCVQVCLCI